MLLKWFIKHQWKQSFRSTIFQRNLAVNIFLGFVVLILFLEFLIGGIYISAEWQELFPDNHPVTKFNSYLLYYFAVDFVMRFFLQSLPIMSIEPYLHLPIRKKSIVYYLLGKASLSLFNFFPYLVLVPFAIFQVKTAYSVEQAWYWIIGLGVSILTMNYFLVYMKRQLSSNPKIVGIFGLFIGLLILLDNIDIFSISTISSTVFDAMILEPFYFLIPILLLFMVYLLNYRFLYQNMYPEEIIIKKNQKADSISDIKYLKRKGKLGELIKLEIRLFLRHKRTKSILYMSCIFVFYGLLFYPNEDMSNIMMSILIGWIMTGIFIANYLNYAFSYESNYFDALLAQNIDMKDYFKYKIQIATLVGSFFFFCTIPYVYFGTEILLVNFCVFLYNIGFMSFMLLYFATYNKKRMELGKSAAFNYQGMNASNWLAIFPAMICPILVFAAFNAFGFKYLGLIAIALMGIIGLLFSKSIINVLVKQFEKRKYIMAEGFREK